MEFLTSTDQVSIYGLNQVFGMPDLESIDCHLKSFDLRWELELNPVREELDSISVKIKGFSVYFDWEVLKEELSGKQLEIFSDLDCKNHPGKLKGSVELQSSESYNGKPWKIKNNVKFGENGSYRFNNCEIYLHENFIELH